MTAVAACSSVHQRHKSDYEGGGADTDCETQPPSDTDRSSSQQPPPVHYSLLHKMEQLNRINELDARSVTSRRSGSSESAAANDLTVTKSRQNSVQPDDDDELDLWTVWGELVKNWELETKKRPNYVKDLVKRGIPSHFRTIAWQLLSGANVLLIHDVYAEYMRLSSPHEKVIVRDISRTYPELEFFKDAGRGQQSLFNVIKAYSIHDKEVGYCQGSAFIVGQLLLQMPEEEAFAVFVRLMDEYRLRELYKPAMTELGLCMFQLECLVQEQMPDLHTHFNNMGFDTSMYASSWFLTLFTTTLPLELANRIMDIFLYEGMEIIFRLALAILQQARIDLLKLDMEGMLKYFQREIRERYENDYELLFAVASNVTLNAKKMKRLEKDYLTKRTKEQEEAIELRRLRTENRLLRQRIEYLEQESGALADRLIRGQVNLAQEAENRINIAHELYKLRDINGDAHRRLEDAYETIRELSSRNKEEFYKETGVQVDDKTMIEHIHALQQELIETNSREADNENTIRDLKQRVHELESTNKRLKETPPDHCVAGLQDELISVKMREAESSLSLKEMRQRLAEIEMQWTKFVHQRSSENGTERRPSPSVDGIHDSHSQQQPSPPTNSARTRLAKLTATLIGGGGSVDSNDSTDNNNSMSYKELEDLLMGVRIRASDTIGELKEMRQRVMELETQNHVCTNQLRRQDEELRRLRDEREAVLQREKDINQLLRDEQRKAIEMQSELKEQSVMQRLKYTEAMQQIADLKQGISQLELKKAEKWTHSQLRGSSVCDMDDDSIGGGTHSITSGDALSIGGSESGDLSALIADLTVQMPAELLTDDGGSTTETDERRQTMTNALVDCGGDDTTDSGVQMSDR